MILQEVVTAMSEAYGHGGLTWAAGKLGMSVSAWRRRVRSVDGAFDPVTLRASLLVINGKDKNFKSDTPPFKSVQTGRIVVDLYKVDDEIIPIWKTAQK
jgi:hypothetical protein